MMRIGVVGFINTLPLAYGLQDFLPGAEIIHATPAKIADDLSDGNLDVGLVPVALLPAHPTWQPVPGLGIAAEGPVRSVLLVSRVPVTRVRRLVTDPASRTSNYLAQLLLTHEFGITPEVVPGPADPESRLAAGDATVIIGDDALAWPGSGEVLDLGGAWTAWTGLPFVFAVWAGPGAAVPELREALAACYRQNAARIQVLAQQVPDASKKAVEAYLTHSIRYRLGKRETQGLARYLELGVAAGFFPGTAEGAIHVHAG